MHVILFSNLYKNIHFSDQAIFTTDNAQGGGVSVNTIWMDPTVFMSANKLRDFPCKLQM